MFTTSQAWQTILAHAQQLESIRVPLQSALGRTLRADARAGGDSPPFDSSAMDGYASRLALPAQPLRLIGESSAGRPFAGAVGPGECVRIFTGAPVPAGAERVIKQEDVTREGDLVRVLRTDSPDFIRRRGENRRAGDLVVSAGTPLAPTELAALASAGITSPEVTRAPRCAHLVTGNELVAPDESPGAAQIRDSNSTLIAALLQRQGAELAGHARARDDLAAAQTIVASLPAHDVLLISGGANAGDYDIARPLLQALGYTLHFQAVNLRPGKPMVFASRGARLAFALPGNPVAHWVVFQLFIAPLLQHLQTGAAAEPARLAGRLAPGSALPPPDARHTFWPCRATIVGGTYELRPLPLASSGDSSKLAGANALLPVPSPAPKLDSDQPVEFIPCP
jgi:molybdopterin molybdotransferase